MNAFDITFCWAVSNIDCLALSGSDACWVGRSGERTLLPYLAQLRPTNRRCCGRLAISTSSKPTGSPFSRMILNGWLLDRGDVTAMSGRETTLGVSGLPGRAGGLARLVSIRPAATRWSCRPCSQLALKGPPRLPKCTGSGSTPSVWLTGATFGRFTRGGRSSGQLYRLRTRLTPACTAADSVAPRSPTTSRLTAPPTTISGYRISQPIEPRAKNAQV